MGGGRKRRSNLAPRAAPGEAPAAAGSCEGPTRRPSPRTGQGSTGPPHPSPGREPGGPRSGSASRRDGAGGRQPQLLWRPAPLQPPPRRWRPPREQEPETCGITRFLFIKKTPSGYEIINNKRVRKRGQAADGGGSGGPQGVPRVPVTRWSPASVCRRSRIAAAPAPSSRGSGRRSAGWG